MNQPIYEPSRIALAPLTVWGISPPELVTVASEAAYDAIGVKLYSAKARAMPHPMAAGSPMMKETLARLSDTGLSVLDVETFYLEPGMTFDAFGALLDAAAELGAENLLVGVGTPDLSEAGAQFGRLCELARPYGLTPCLEFFPAWIGVPDLARARAILACANHPAGRLLLDTLHAHRTGLSPTQLHDLAPGELCYVQLSDASANEPTDPAALELEAMQGRLLPGEGVIALDQFLAAVEPGLPVSIEVPVRERLGLDDAHVHATACMAAARRVFAGVRPA